MGGVYMAWVDFAICFCLGYFGVHKFMDGKKGMGILYLCTFGLFGIGWMYDCIVYFINAIKGKRSIGKNKGISNRTLADNEPLPIVQASNVLMTAGEICHYYKQATFVKTKNVVVGYTGGSRGVNIKVMKGMSYHVGSSKSQPIRGNVQEKTPGMLTITNKRIIFSGSEGAFDKKITSLSSITPYTDGILFQFGEKQYPLMLKEPIFVYQIVARIINSIEV